MTYAESVLDHADHEGNLSVGDTEALLWEHDCTLSAMENPEERNAQALLTWLGY